MSQAKDILRQLVQFNTIADKQNKQLMSYIGHFLTAYNFNIEQLGQCLIARRGQSSLGFIGHTDTVPYASWDGDPFVLQEKNGRLIGLGACDMKGGLAAMLTAVTLLNQDQALSLYFTYDEEISMKGIKSIRDKIVEPTVIIGEPTDNQPVYATKGVLEARVVFTGVKCHSSTPQQGVSAIELCVDFINQLRQYACQLQKTPTLDFAVPYTTVNIGLIKGGESVNSVAGKCEISLDFRIASLDDLRRLQQDLPAMVNKYQGHLIIKQNLPPRINTSDLSFLEKAAGQKQTKCYLTEGSYIDNNFIILGPGPDTSHQKNEYITIASLEETVALYKLIIDHYTQAN